MRLSVEYEVSDVAPLEDPISPTKAGRPAVSRDAGNMV